MQSGDWPSCSPLPQKSLPAHLLFHQRREVLAAPGVLWLRSSHSGRWEEQGSLPGSTVPSILSPAASGLPRRTEFSSQLTAGHCTPAPVTGGFPCRDGYSLPIWDGGSPNSLPHRQEEEPV